MATSRIEKIVAKNSSRSADQIAQALLAEVKKEALAGQDNSTVLAIGFDKMKTRK